MFTSLSLFPSRTYNNNSVTIAWITDEIRLCLVAHIARCASSLSPSTRRVCKCYGKGRNVMLWEKQSKCDCSSEDFTKPMLSLVGNYGFVALQFYSNVVAIFVFDIFVCLLFRRDIGWICKYVFECPMSWTEIKL